MKFLIAEFNPLIIILRFVPFLNQNYQISGAQCFLS